MRIQISTNVSAETRRQANELMESCGYSLRDVVTLAIEHLYQQRKEEATMYLPTLASCEPGQDIFTAAQEAGYRPPDYLVSIHRYKTRQGNFAVPEKADHEPVGTVEANFGEQFVIYKKVS